MIAVGSRRAPSVMRTRRCTLSRRALVVLEPVHRLGPAQRGHELHRVPPARGTELDSQGILVRSASPRTTRGRNNFFTDYLWAVKGGLGEDLSSIIQAEVDFWDASD